MILEAATRIRLLVLLALSLSLSLSLSLVDAAPAAAQGGAAAQARIRELDRQALADYRAEDFDSARIGLREAIALANRAGLINDPIMARLWLHLGAVLINGVKDAEKGARALAVAVRITPNIQLPASLTTPELTEALAAAKAGQAAKAAGAPPPGTPADPAAAPAPPAPPAAGAPPLPPGGPAPSPTAPSPEAAPADPAAEPAAAAPPPPRRRKKRGGGDEPDPPANIPRPLYCPSADEAPPGEDIVLHCVMQAEVNASKVTLHYRPPGEEGFVAAEAKRSPGGWYRVVIPGDVVSGKLLHYYVEAKDAKGEVVGNAGRDDSPNLVMVRDGAPSFATGFYAGMSGPRREGDDEDEDAGDGEREDDDPLKAVARQREREREAAGVHRRLPETVFIGLGVGSGYGWHPRGRLEFYDDAIIEAGWIPSGLLHVLPEVGYQFADRAAVSLQARAQFISQQGSGDQKPGAPASGAVALLARLQYFLGGGNLQGSLSAYAGGGNGFRLTIGPQGNAYRRNDSVRGGPLVAGAGAGAIYHLNSNFAMVFDAKGLYGLGLSSAANRAFVLDAGLGVQLAF